MRHHATDAEKRLWSRLRDRRLEGFKFRRQVPIAGFIVDFYCIERMLAIELDGGQHLDEGPVDYDRRRARQLDSLGIRTLRFSNVDVLRDTELVVTAILRTLTEPSPQPSPGVPGEGQRM
jgi:type I restriction enzyme M protein